jgi:LysM repeat protein
MAANMDKLIYTKATHAAIAKAKELGLRITSGYRTNAESVAVGGYAGDNHTTGMSLDVAGNWNAMDKFAKWAKSSGLFRYVLWQTEGHYNHVHVTWNKDTASNGGKYTVQSGDTLSGIAAKFNMDLEDIKKLNEQIKNPNLIIVGQVINVGGGKTYIVKSGDTLSGIAAAHGISLSALKAANPQIKNFNLIVVGEKINIPFF